MINDLKFENVTSKLESQPLIYPSNLNINCTLFCL